MEGGCRACVPESVAAGCGRRRWWRLLELPVGRRPEPSPSPSASATGPSLALPAERNVKADREDTH